MSTVNTVLPEFRGFAVQYDPTIKPYFMTSVIEQLRIIVSKPLGKELLDDIADAQPIHRTAGSGSDDLKDIQFPLGINVVVVPAMGKDAVQLSQSGFKLGYRPGTAIKDVLVPSDNAFHNATYKRSDGQVELCSYHADEGGSNAEAFNKQHSSDGQGTVSVMKFTNAQIMTRKGEPALPFMVLAHELIHCLHHVTGTTFNLNEEPRTVGFPPYDTEKYTEQKFRAAFNKDARKTY